MHKTVAWQWGASRIKLLWSERWDMNEWYWPKWTMGLIQWATVSYGPRNLLFFIYICLQTTTRSLIFTVIEILLLIPRASSTIWWLDPAPKLAFNHLNRCLLISNVIKWVKFEPWSDLGSNSHSDMQLGTCLSLPQPIAQQPCKVWMKWDFISCVTRRTMWF